MEAVTRGRLLLDDATTEVCVVPVVAGTASYPLHPAVYELVRVDFKSASDDLRQTLKIVTREWLDNRYWNWRDWKDCQYLQRMVSC